MRKAWMCTIIPRRDPDIQKTSPAKTKSACCSWFAALPFHWRDGLAESSWVYQSLPESTDGGSMVRLRWLSDGEWWWACVLGCWLCTGSAPPVPQEMTRPLTTSLVDATQRAIQVHFSSSQQLMGRQLSPNQRQLSGPIHRSLGILLDCTSKTKEILSNTDSTNKRQSATVVAFAGACVIACDGGHDV